MSAVVRFGSVALALGLFSLTMQLACGTGAQPVGRNQDPVIEITTGPAGASYAWGELFTVAATVSDEEDEPDALSVVATAGGLALGEYTPDGAGAIAFEVDTAEFDGGTYTLLLKVVDSAGASVNATEEFTVVRSDTPQVQIVFPTEADTLCATLVSSLEASISDGDDDPSTLLASWESDLEGNLGEELAVGADGSLLTDAVFTVPGLHLLTLTVVDPQDVTGTAEVAVTVATLGECNMPPDVTIGQPLDGDAFTEGECVDMLGTVADDLDDPQDLLISWDSHLDHTLGTAPADAHGTATHTECGLSVGEHFLSLRAEDALGEAGLETITIEVCMDLDGDGQGGCAGDCDDLDPDVSAADLDGDGVDTCSGDCDDGDPLTYPGAAESCDGLDNNCDNGLPADEHDGDGDGMWECQGDCDDNDPAIYLGAPELCDGLDNDCDGMIDNGCAW